MFGGYTFVAVGLRQADRQRAHRERQLGVPLEGRLRPRRLGRLHGGRDGVLPLHGRLHGHHGDDPHRRHGRAVEVERVRRLGPLLRRALLPAVRRVDLGRRLARQLGQERAPRLRLHRLRRLRRRARDGRHRRSRRSPRPRAPHREVRQGRQAASARAPSHPDGHARHVHPACSAGSASTPHRRSSATDIRFAVVATNTAIAAAFGAVIAMFWIDGSHRQARPGDDGQRHARRPRRDHRAVRLRAAVGGRGARRHRRGPRRRVGVVLRAQGEDRRSRRRDLGARCVRHLGCLVRRHLRRRPVRPGLERHRSTPTPRTVSPASSTAGRAGVSWAPRPSVPSRSSS